MAKQHITHLWECTAASHCGVPRGTTRSVPAGSDADKRYEVDPAWTLRAEVAVKDTEARGGEASALLEQARAALDAGNRSGAIEHIRRALRILDEKDRDSGVLAERAREERGEKAKADRAAQVKKLAEMPLSDQPARARTLTKTELARANKSELLVALREAGTYRPGLETKSNDELRAALRDAYGYDAGEGADDGSAPEDADGAGEEDATLAAGPGAGADDHPSVGDGGLFGDHDPYGDEPPDDGDDPDDEE